MTDTDLIMKLAKVIIAAAWADGAVSEEEMNELKRLLLRLRQTSSGRGVDLTGQQWAQLQMYMELPVDEAERARLVQELSQALSSSDEKRFVVQALRDLAAVDGQVSQQEEVVVAEIEAALQEAGKGRLGRLGRMFGGGAQITPAAGVAPNRENYFDDFLRNKVYYNLAQRGRMGEFELQLTDAEQRKLGLAGGLMAKLAHIDGQVSDDELDNMRRAIQRHWSLSDFAAAFVVETALATVNETYDTVRMMTELANIASETERQQFLTALFALAASDGEVGLAEHEEIRFIARGIDLDHEAFIAAKLQAKAAK
jgi:uncharacterized tellurite resistance protein B-like protein